ncbi:ATP-binding protein [Streptomyces anulatus]
MTETEEPLAARIARQAKSSEADVRDVFATYGLPLTLTPARPRGLRLHRMRVAGLRTGSLEPGPFDTTFRFGAGLTALVASNLRGKTSVLELITWCLRGTPRDLQSGVRNWIRQLDLDIVVAGQPLGFRLDCIDGEIVRAQVLTGSDIGSLETARTPDDTGQITTLITAGSAESYAQHIQAFMLDRLDLQPLLNTLNETGTQAHGWPAYYGAIYLPAGGDKVLLGDQMMGGLPGRLLQVFLDLPAAATLTRVRAAHDVRSSTAKRRKADAHGAFQQRREERERKENELREARARLAALPGPGEDESLTSLAAEAARRAREVADAQETWEGLMRVHRRAVEHRRREERLLNDVSESLTARLLFHGLDPQACPRCDQEIAEDRRLQERDHHACAVCARPVTGEDDNPQEVQDEARLRLEQAKEAEATSRQALEAAEAELTRLTDLLAASQTRLREAQSVLLLPQRVQAQEEILRLEGALSVLPDLPENTGDPYESTIVNVLKAGVTVLDSDSKSAAERLFEDVNEEIADLGRRFGITSLEKVEINRAAQLKVIKDGGAADYFSKLSAGERLRLRIAVVIALLRVGAAHGLSTHPGLLLIDSPKAEEIQDLDAHSLVTELAKLADENSLQVLITTADFTLANGVLPKDRIVEAAEGRPMW